MVWCQSLGVGGQLLVVVFGGWLSVVEVSVGWAVMVANEETLPTNCPEFHTNNSFVFCPRSVTLSLLYLYFTPQCLEGDHSHKKLKLNNDI